jgi:hypothetical protein
MNLLFQINGPNGRWKESNLANLLGEEREVREERAVAVEGQMQEVELQPITKQPFSHYPKDPQPFGWSVPTIEPA